MARVPASAPDRAEGKDVGAFDDRDATEWATTLNDVRDYGAEMDGSTDDSAAFQAAIDDSTGAGEAAYVPGDDGTLYLGESVTLDAGHNGATIVGDGFDSHVRSDATGNALDGIIEMWDSDAAMSDMTVANVNLEGAGGNSAVDPRQTGIRFRYDGSNEFHDENIRIENCWVHDCNSSNIDVVNKDIFVGHCTVYRAGQFHGLVGKEVEKPSIDPVTRFEHILGWANGQHTVDASSGSFDVDVVMSFDDARHNSDAAGFKTSANHGTSTLSRIHVEGSNGHGVNMVGDVEEIEYQDVVVVDSAGEGIPLQGSGLVVMDNVYTVGNAENGLFLNDDGLTVDIGYIEAYGNEDHYGVTVNADAGGEIDLVVGEGNALELVNEGGDVTVHDEQAGSCDVPDVIPDREPSDPAASGVQRTTASGVRRTTIGGRYET